MVKTDTQTKLNNKISILIFPTIRFHHPMECKLFNFKDTKSTTKENCSYLSLFAISRCSNINQIFREDHHSLFSE